jgi:WD40 repeat protein
MSPTRGRHRGTTQLMSQPPDTVEAYVLFHPSTAARAAELGRSLRSRDVELRQLQTVDGAERTLPVLVLLCDELVAENRHLLTQLDGWEGQIIPVKLARLNLEPPEPIRSISPLDLQDVPAGDAAERISLSLRVPPEWLLAWRELQATADRYLEAGGGSRSSVLLSAGDLARANRTVLERPRRVVPALPTEIHGLLAASERAVQRARTMRVMLASLVIILLAVTAVVAAIQRESALQAAASARSAARHTEADRLDRLAIGELRTDPDLPTLLARRAYALAPGSSTKEVLRRALDSGPWHRSYRLGGLPAGLASSPHSPLVAVSFSDGSLGLFDSREGRMVAEVPVPHGYGGVPVASLSADGRLLAVAYNGGLVQVRSADAAFGLLFSRRYARLARAESLSLAWRRGGQYLLGSWSGQPALLLDTHGHGARPVASSAVAAASAVAVSSDGSLTAVAGMNRVAIVKNATMKACAVIAESVAPTGASVVFDDARDTVVLLVAGGAPVQIPIPRKCHASAGAAPEDPLWPAASGGTGTAVLTDGTVAVATLSGNVVLQVPPATYTVGSFLAATGSLNAVSPTSGGLVTVGEDHWLRVWDVGTPAPTYPVYPAQQIDLNETPGAPPATWRPLIAVNEAGTRVSTGGNSTGYLWVGDARDLSKPGLRVFVTLDTSIRPTRTGRCAAVIINSGGYMGELKCGPEHLLNVWHRNPKGDPDLPTLSNSAISSDGHLVALAGHTEVELANTSTRASWRFALPGLTSIAFDRANELVGAEANGALVRIGPSGSVRQVRVDLGDQVRAAGVEPAGRRVLMVSPDGKVALVSTSNGAVLRRLSLGSGLGSAIDARFSENGRLAVILARDGYWVIDIERWRTIAADERYEESDLGAQPRDAAFLGASDGFLLLRADEGIQRVELARWRFLDGQALLHATAGAVPRRLAPGEAQAPSALPSEAP